MSRLPDEPSLWGKTRYALGMRLPQEHREWVRHDLTDAGWRLRALARQVVLITPVALALALLPGPVYVHLMLPAFVLLASLFTAAAYGDDIRASRLRQHDLPVPDDPDLGRPPH